MRTEALLLAADRAEHVAEVVTLALDEGRWVVTDRFSGSTLAYQGHGRGLDLGELAQLVTWATGGVEADLNVFVDVPLSVARERAHSHDGSGDRLERLDEDFHERVRHGYLELAATDEARLGRGRRRGRGGRRGCPDRRGRARPPRPASRCRRKGSPGRRHDDVDEPAHRPVRGDNDRVGRHRLAVAVVVRRCRRPAPCRGQLRAAARRPVHAYVLVGEAGLGQRALVRGFAAALLCPDGGCGHCGVCRRTLRGLTPTWWSSVVPAPP